ncbi:hypothetical protein BGZ93_001784 [Podila epicladia]|nr:hypothetical protein BGZ92_002434 [Podila epicladia]KAG0083475.1 hypothetical protein BGZ93_001784 [Podila epicladia]
MSDKFHLTKTPSNTQLLPEYNVLVLGETQSGKSTLIQYMRKYAEPTTVIDTAALGTGFLSHTQEVIRTKVFTDLPEYYVEEKKGVDRVNYGEFLNIPDEYDYEDALNLRKGLETKKGAAQLPKKVKFNLIDTPGLNATQGDDEKHVQKIFRGLNEAKTIHLLLITISSGPFTQGLKDAIRAYVDMFPGFNGIIAFVHTHFDYKNFHPARAQVSHAIDLRTESLHEIMGRTTFPHFKIDCDVYNKKPIRDCITQNTIQKILELATFNQPVNMLQTVVNKTRKMRDIDNILKDKFEATSATIEKTLRFKVPEEGDLLAEIFHNETNVHKLEARIKVLIEFFVRHNVTLLEVLHEERRDDVIGQEGNVTIRYPKAGELGFAIKKRDLLCHNVKVLNEVGSEDDKERWTSWQGDFQRTSPQNSVLHVKIYTTKSNLHREEIKEKQIEYEKLTLELEEAKKLRDSHALKNESKKQQIKEIVNNHSEGIQILGFVSNEVLAPNVFNALMEVEAYIGDTAVCAKKVEKVYMDLAKLEPTANSGSPTSSSPNIQKKFPFGRK